MICECGSENIEPLIGVPETKEGTPIGRCRDCGKKIFQGPSIFGKLAIDELSPEEKGKKMLIYLVAQVMKGLEKDKVKKIDSNYFHFVIYNVLKKFPELEKQIPTGWYYHGPYIPWLDDVLVETFKMDKKYHQLDGEKPCCYEFSETEFEEAER